MNLIDRENAVCLNGYWDLTFLSPSKTAEAALSDAEWIRNQYIVPSTWVVSDPMYDIFQYPEAWKKESHGMVRRTVPVCYKPGTRVFLRFDAVGQQAILYLNGKKVSATQDMFLPFETEITDFLLPGDNTLDVALECMRFPRSEETGRLLVPSGTWFAGCTYGIWQDAWLITRPAAFVSTCAIETLWEEKKIRVRAETDGQTSAILGGRILDADGNIVLTLGETLSSDWNDPHPWMPDDPYLYTLILTMSENGTETPIYSQRFGFREFTHSGPDLFINGTKLHLRGDAWHYQGLIMQSKEYAKNWYRYAMEQGINLVRPHGFPYPQCFYDAADECGMLLMAESGIYGSGKNMQADDPRYIDACRKHLHAFVRDYRNHPSVICWSMQNEMRWVDGREGFKEYIPELMAIVHEEDPCGRIVSCDGDNRLLTPAMMEAVSMHYNIDGLISDWHGDKPLFFGEHGAYHYVAPQCAADFRGENAYTSFWSAMQGISDKEAMFMRYARRKNVSAVTPFNYVNYMNTAMPLEDTVVDQGDITLPGVHPRFLPAGCLPVNNGMLKEYPVFLPQPALSSLRRETAQIAVLPCESNTAFYGGETVSRRFLLYNDTYRKADAEITSVWRRKDGRILLMKKDSLPMEAGSSQLLTYKVPMPVPFDKEEITVSFEIRFNGKVVKEELYSYRVFARLPGRNNRQSVVCFGKPGSVPSSAAAHVSYIETLDELSSVNCDLLILGEGLLFTQEQLQPVLSDLLTCHKVGSLLILCQDRFAPGLLTHSKKSFFSLHKTGEHPVLSGLSTEDLRMWAEENPLESMENALVTDAFDKPSENGYRVLLECAQGDFGWGGMNWCALLEAKAHDVPVLLTQIRLDAFTSSCPVAERLYAGCVSYLLSEAAKAEKTSLLSVPFSSDFAVSPLKDALQNGQTVFITGCDENAAPLLSSLLGREVQMENAPTYQTRRTRDPLGNGLSDADLTGLLHTTYSSADLKNIPCAKWAFDAAEIRPLVVSADTPWEALFTGYKDAEFVKVRYATLFDRAEHPYHTYLFAAEAGNGMLIASSLASENLTGLARMEDVIRQNVGYFAETGLLESIKKPAQHAIAQIMWLPVSEKWDYETAVAYHAAPDFLLNNLGEGSYGWMQRVLSDSGKLRMPGSKKKGVFATVFVHCALNHDPEHREGGIPDPTIVPDMTLTTNRPVRVYVNGRLFRDAEGAEGTATFKIEDTLLLKGVNRLFFEILPGEEDAEIEAVFRDKLGNYPEDISYLCTLD